MPARKNNQPRRTKKVEEDPVEEEEDQVEEEEAPAPKRSRNSSKKTTSRKKATKKATKNPEPESEDEDQDEEEEAPAPKRSRKAPSKKTTSRKKATKKATKNPEPESEDEDQDEEEEAPAPKRSRKTSSKKTTSRKKATKKATKKPESDEEEEKAPVRSSRRLATNKDGKREFRIIESTISPGFPDGSPSLSKGGGKYCGMTPLQSAKKAFTAIARVFGQDYWDSEDADYISFSVEEITKGGKGKAFAYIGKRERLEKPEEIIRQGTAYQVKFKNKVRADRPVAAADDDAEEE